MLLQTCFNGLGTGRALGAQGGAQQLGLSPLMQLMSAELSKCGEKEKKPNQNPQHSQIGGQRHCFWVWKHSRQHFTNQLRLTDAF